VSQTVDHTLGARPIRKAPSAPAWPVGVRGPGGRISGASDQRAAM